MQVEFLSKEKLFINPTKFTQGFLNSDSYEDMYDRIIHSNLEFDETKTYEIASGGFMDFNQHLYEDENHMNSISAGITLEKCLVAFQILIWSSTGAGYLIFNHIFSEEEVKMLCSIEDIKDYIHTHLHELEQGILQTFGKDVQKSFEDFGRAIEETKLPLQSLFQYLSVENNIK